MATRGQKWGNAMIKRMQSLGSQLLSQQSGQSMTEYALVVGLMAIVTVATVSAIGSGISNAITSSITSSFAAAWPS